MSVTGGKWKVRPQAWLLAAVAVAAGGIAWATRQGWAAVVLAAVGVFLPVADLLIGGKRAQADDIDLEKVADRLALAVRKQWADEAKRREITSPPLAVSWRPASQSLVQSWSYLQQLSADGAGWPAPTATATGPQDLAGSGPQILATYDRTPCGRLVVLGEPGAGKTVLLIRLVLDFLARRADGEPVPLLVPLASWSPEGQSLTDWLEGQILRTYPHLTGAISAGRKSRARALLDDGLILPVLDGLDEIRGGSRAQALAKINATLGNHTGIVLSSRVKAFRHAVRPRPGVGPIRLEGAAGIRLDPLTPHAVADYLVVTAGDGGETRWTAVRTAASTSGTPLARTLVTPLMASLARTVYNPCEGESVLGLPNPADLTALPTAADIERHLFEGFIPAAYRPHPDSRLRWDGERADRYLAFLARHLEHRLHTTSLAWWELASATSWAYRILMFGLVAGFSSGLVIGLMFGPTVGLTAGLMIGLITGLQAGLGAGLGSVQPTRMVLRRPTPRVIVFGLVFGQAAGFTAGLGAGLGLGPVAGLVAGLGVAVGVAVGVGGETPVDTGCARDPKAVLALDRTNVFASLAVWPMIGLVFGLLGKPVIGLVIGLALASALVSAWGRLGLARLWLAARRHTPLRLIAFLEDAHERGVLRQAGAVWEFRHANLQRYLAGPP
jgi:hypothetical protein